ncbi:MAG TPA: hypothetical protein VFM25_08785 [Verrucomicrobiae bacterium]|nr:hypothetical protein [Verrucomicrobiae bacterium]
MMTPVNVQALDAASGDAPELVAPGMKRGAARTDFLKMMAQALSPDAAQTTDKTPQADGNVSLKTHSRKKNSEDKNAAQNSNPMTEMALATIAPSAPVPDLKSRNVAENAGEIPERLERVERPARKSVSVPMKMRQAAVIAKFSGSVSTAPKVEQTTAFDKAPSQPDSDSVPPVFESDAKEMPGQTGLNQRGAVPSGENFGARMVVSETPDQPVFPNQFQAAEVVPKNARMESVRDDQVFLPKTFSNVPNLEESFSKDLPDESGNSISSVRDGKKNANAIPENNSESKSKAVSETRLISRAPVLEKISPRELSRPVEKNEPIGISESESANSKIRVLADDSISNSDSASKIHEEKQIPQDEPISRIENRKSKIEIPNRISDDEKKFSTRVGISSAEISAELEIPVAKVGVLPSSEISDQTIHATPVPMREVRELARDSFGEKIEAIQNRFSDLPASSISQAVPKAQEESRKDSPELKPSNSQTKPDENHSAVSDKSPASSEKNSNSHETSPEKKRDDSSQRISVNSTKPASIADGKAAAKQESPMKLADEQNEIAGSTVQNLPRLDARGEISFRPEGKSEMPGVSAAERKEKTISENPIVALTEKVGTSVSGKEISAARVLSDGSAANAVERLSKLVGGEAVAFRRSGAEAVTISLKLDSRTEISLGLASHHGQVQALIHCERGDLAGAENHWGQLRESLARHNVELLPLQKSDFSKSAWNFSSGAGSRNFQPSGQQHGRDPQARFLSEELPPAPRESGAFQKTKKTQSARGWESWA